MRLRPCSILTGYFPFDENRRGLPELPDRGTGYYEDDVKLLESKQTAQVLSWAKLSHHVDADKNR